MAITRVGVGAQVTDAGVATTATWPSGYTPVDGDVGILIAAAKTTSAGVDATAPAGWTMRVAQQRATSLRAATYFREILSTDSEPTLTPPAEWASHSVQLVVYRGVNLGDVFDASEVIDNNATSATFQATGITTVTANAVVVNVVASADDNQLSMTTANGFSDFMSGAAYTSIAGSDHAVGAADQTIASPGAVTNPVWTQTVNGNDIWVAITMALKPATGSPTTVAPGVGAVVLAGLTPTIGLPVAVRPGVGAVVLAGFAPDLSSGVNVAPGLGQVVLAGLAPTVGLPRTVAPGVGAVVLAGFAPSVTSGVFVRPGVGAVAIAGFAPTIGLPRTVLPGTGAIVLAGFAPTVGSPKVVVPGVGAIAIQGFAPTINISATVRPGAGALVLAGFAPTLKFVAESVGWVEFDVFLDASTAGTFAFRWAQNVSKPDSLIVLSGSYLEYVKL